MKKAMYWIWTSACVLGNDYAVRAMIDGAEQEGWFGIVTMAHVLGISAAFGFAWYVITHFDEVAKGGVL